MHIPNKFELYRTAQQCCEDRFPNSASCTSDSKAQYEIGTGFNMQYPTDAENHWGVEESHTEKWFPDLINKRNCVQGRNYENWMNAEGFQEEYLFNDALDCCEKWYPSRSDCPDNGKAVNPEAEDEAWNPGAMRNYYFPDFVQQSCDYGRDYPAWMGINGYEKHYLFTEANDCCSRFFAGVGGCPLQNSVTDQAGYYWETYHDNLENHIAMPEVYNHTYYADLNARTCVNGTDYPEWMGSDDEFKRLYLFKDLEGCCKQWFSATEFSYCQAHVIQGIYEIEPCPTNRPDCNNTAPVVANATAELLAKWYPDIDGQKCQQDGNTPEWMLHEGYTEWYLFNTQEQCCAAFGYC